MNIAAAIAIVAGTFELAVAFMAGRVARAPGWADQRWFSLIALGAAVYACGDVAAALGWSDPVVSALMHLQLASVFFQLWAWFRYLRDRYGRLSPSAGDLARRGLLGLAVVSLLPGVAISGEVVSRAVPLLDYSSRDPVPTLAGEVLFAIGVAGALVLLAGALSAWRRGREGAGGMALAFSVIVAAGINDALAGSGITALPYLLDVGFMVPVAVVGWDVARRFVADAEALEALRSRLESLVEARTRDLTRAEEALRQAEKLAALGQFAAGVAHEVNSPASVVIANLRYLSELAAEGGSSQEAESSLRDAVDAMMRINALVRRLVDAGRFAARSASAPTTMGAAAVSAVLERVIDEARVLTGDRVTFTSRVMPEAQVAVPVEVLHQVLAALMLNAAEAIPAGRRGLIVVTAERPEPGTLRLSVADNGAGMTSEVARHAFEPFFTTKDAGKGSGLGLPVARALAERHGGGLWLESDPGVGTRAVLELPAV